MDLFKENSPNKLNFHLFSANGSNIEKFPIKIREIYGVQHMKFLIFDDTIILTGANISKTYLMNRQDRYYVIKNSPNLKRFLISCYETITKFCYKIVEYEFTFNDKLPCNDNMSLFIVILASEINKMIQYYSQNCDLTFGQFNEQRHKLESNYAIIFPLIQFGKCNILNIDNFIKHIIKTLPNHQSSILITSAYINFDDNIEKTISRVASKECIFDLVLPNPKTNSFYQGGFLMNHISGMYSLFIQKLYKEYCPNDNIRLYEYRFNGNTYHAKGIWIESKNDVEPIFTLFGSSNLNQRSTVRDLELNFALYTSDKLLKNKIQNESHQILQNSHPLCYEACYKKEYDIPILCHLLKYIARSYF
ncbi:MAG: CDP-diacylglycerol--glycerol-3-phosphate 3-phosphatidyltransferase, variant 2 [Marteilia pararefringens]